MCVLCISFVLPTIYDPHYTMLKHTSIHTIPKKRTYIRLEKNSFMYIRWWFDSIVFMMVFIDRHAQRLIKFLRYVILC